MFYFIKKNYYYYFFFGGGGVGETGRETEEVRVGRLCVWWWGGGGGECVRVCVRRGGGEDRVRSDL